MRCLHCRSQRLQLRRLIDKRIAQFHGFPKRDIFQGARCSNPLDQRSVGA
jgi:hypothetical protein